LYRDIGPSDAALSGARQCVFHMGICRWAPKDPGRRFSSTSQSQLGQDAADVVLDRFGTDEETLADLEIGQTVADEVEDLALS
jgi:hypothetical protein